MKYFNFLAFIALFAMIASLQAKNYATYNLPEGAVMRLGKGKLIDAKFFRTVDKLAILTKVGIWIHDSNTGEELTFLIEDYHEPKNFDISSDDSMIAVGTLQGNILVWDLTSEKVLMQLKAYDQPVTYTKFGSEDQFLLSRTTERKNDNYTDKILIWSLESGKRIKSIDCQRNNLISFDEEVNRFSVFSDKKVEVFTFPEAKRINLLDLQDRSGRYGFIKLKDRLLLEAGRTSPDTTRLWRLLPPTKEISSAVRVDYITGYGAAAISADGTLLASDHSPDYKHIEIWDLTSGKRIKKLIKGFLGQLRLLEFSPDGKILAANGLSGQLVFWDVSNWFMVSAINLFEITNVHERAIGRHGYPKISFSYDSDCIVFPSKDRVFLYSLITKKVLRIEGFTDNYSYSGPLAFDNKSEFVYSRPFIWSLGSKDLISHSYNANHVINQKLKATSKNRILEAQILS